MNVTCPICLCKAGNYKRKIDKYFIYKCAECGLEYTDSIPTDDDLYLFYNSYKDIRADTTIVQINAKNNRNKLLAYGLTKDSKILDFGCGNGEFVEICGINCYGVELGEHIDERIYNTIEKLPIKKFEFITLWGVLEHINNIKDIMKNLAKYLKKGGYIMITTVDAEGKIPYYYKPPEHLTYWTKRSLNVLANYLECDVKEISEYNMEQFSHIYIDRLLSRTPENYARIIKKNIKDLPKIVNVPTNEFFAVLKKR